MNRNLKLRFVSGCFNCPALHEWDCHLMGAGYLVPEAVIFSTPPTAPDWCPLRVEAIALTLSDVPEPRVIPPVTVEAAAEPPVVKVGADGCTVVLDTPAPVTEDELRDVAGQLHDVRCQLELKKSALAKARGEIDQFRNGRTSHNSLPREINVQNLMEQAALERGVHQARLAVDITEEEEKRLWQIVDRYVRGE